MLPRGLRGRPRRKETGTGTINTRSPPPTSSAGWRPPIHEMKGPYTHYRMAGKTPHAWRPACQRHPGDPIPRLDDPSTSRPEEVTCGLCLDSEGMMGFRDHPWWKDRSG